MKRVWLLAVAALLAAGCGGEQPVDTSLQFRRQAVVRGLLQADSAFSGVTVANTIPLGGTAGSSMVTDAELYLRINGVQIIPLLHTRQGLYMPGSRLIIKSGELYELFGVAAGKTFYAATTVPSAPVISGALLRDSTYLTANVTLRAGACYGALWKMQGASAGDFHSLVSIPPGESGPYITAVRTIDLPGVSGNPLLFRSLKVQVFAYDAAFAEYFATRNNDRAVSNAYIQGSGNVAWNVTGEDVIGLFIGCAAGPETGVIP